MILIISIILFFYDLSIENIISEENKRIVFTANDKENYIFEQVEPNNSLIFFINTISNRFHIIKTNKNNSFITIWQGKKYALLKIRTREEDRLISINDLISICKIKIPNKLYLSKNYIELWKNKINYLEVFFKNYYEKDYNDYSYYIYLGRIALEIVKLINFNDITYGLYYNRFDNIETIFNLYDPFNVNIGPVVISFSEFVKYRIFNNEELDDISFLFCDKYTINDYLFLIARLLFPTYYYDLYSNNDKNNYNIILDKQYSFFKLIQKIIKEIKKRYTTKDISFIESLINQL